MLAILNPIVLGFEAVLASLKLIVLDFEKIKNGFVFGYLNYRLH